MPRVNHNVGHSNASNHVQQTNLLTRIEENTKNIKLEAETIDINVADLEALQTTANTTLAAILVDTDAADSSLNTIEAQSVLTASRLNNIQNKISANVDGTGDTLGQINSNILLKNTEIETSLNSILLDSTAIKTSVQLLDNAISGNEMQVDVLTMPTVAVTLSGGATEAKQDDGITHLATIAGDTTSIDGKITACNTGAVVVSSSALPSGAATQSTLNDAEVHLGSIDGKITACNTGAVVVSSSALPSGAATESSLSSLNGKVTACNTGAVVVSSSALPSGAATESTLNDAEVHLGNIETSVQLIDDVVGTDGSTGPGKCISIGGTESGGNIQELLVDSAGHLQIDVLSAPSTAVTNTTLTNLNNCIGTNELQVDIVASLPTGSNAIGKLSANSGVDIGDVDVTSLPLTFNSGNKDATCQRVVVATDDVNLSAIKSSLDNIDNAVDGNYLNVNQNIAGTDVDSNSGNKSSATQRVVIADDDTNLSAIKTAVELLDDAIGTDGSTGPGKCISIGGTESGGNIQELLVDSAGHLQIDVLSAPSTAVTNTTLTNLNNCIGTNELQVDIVASLPTGSNAIGKLSANSGVDIGDVDVTSLPLTFNSGNKDANCQRVVVATDDVNLSAINSSLTTIDSVLDNSLLKQTLATSAEIKELLSNVTVNQAALSAELDTEHYEKIRLFGETSASVGSDIKIFGSNTSGGTYYYLNNGDLMATSLSISGLGTAHYIGGSFENIPRYIKIFNNSGSTDHTFTKLYMVGSGGRLAV